MSQERLRVAFLTTDQREVERAYHLPEPEFHAAPAALLAGLSHLPGLEIHVICCTQQPVRAPARLGAGRRDHGDTNDIFFHNLHVPKIGWLRTGYYGCSLAIRRRLREIQPDVVDAQGTERECAISAVRSGYPNVLTLHGSMCQMARVLAARWGTFHWWAARLENYVLKRTAGVFCNSRYTEGLVRQRTCQTWFSPNALRQAFFSKPPASRVSGKCTILNVGTVCAYKRQNELLDLAEQLQREGLDFELRFIGIAPRADPYAVNFLNRLNASAYGSHVSYLGARPLPELIADYDGASALVHVSKVETFGLVVAEALARNLKFIGFRAGGVPEIAEGVEGAELFADGDWDALKLALTKWVRAGFPCPSNAAEAMRARYHPDVIARQHLAAYRQVLQS
jgi:glycosyltransferase involved in cell wall biosynthesis